MTLRWGRVGPGEVAIFLTTNLNLKIESKAWFTLVSSYALFSYFMGFCNPLLKRPAEYFGLYIRFWSMTYSQKNVHFFTDNIVRKVSSGQICPRFLLTCLSSNFVDILSTKSRPFPFFFYRPFVTPPSLDILLLKKKKNCISLGPNPILICAQYLRSPILIANR